MRQIIGVIAFLFIVGLSMAAEPFDLKYAILHENAIGDTDLVSGAVYDSVTDQLISMAYGGTEFGLLVYSAKNGQPASPPYRVYTPDPDAVEEGNLSGIASIAHEGKLYFFDHSTDTQGRFQRLDGPEDSVAEAITDPAEVDFARDLSMEGTGGDTWIAKVGGGNATAATVQLYRRDAPGSDTFSEVGEITGATLNPPGVGKNGVGISPPLPGLPPQWIVTCDSTGGIRKLRCFQLILPTDFPNFAYVLKDEISGDFMDAAIDPYTEDPAHGIIAIVIAPPTRDPDHEDAEIIKYRILPSGLLWELDRIAIPKIGERTDLFYYGTITLDRINKAAYIGYRPRSPGKNLVVAKVQYDYSTVPPDTRLYTLY